MFAKVFKSIYYGSLQGKKDARDVFICLLTHADRKGLVEYLTVAMIAMLVEISIEEVVDAISILEAPDEQSRSPESDGRRIVKVPGGWQIVNHGKYRSIRDEDDRREQNRIAQSERRLRVANSQPSVSHGQPRSAYAEAEAEAEAEADEEKGVGPEPSASGPVVIRIKTNVTGRTAGILAAEVEAWTRLFPAVDVMAELRKMAAWSEANAARRKTIRGMRRHIVNWLSREQDRSRVTVVPATVEISPEERRRRDREVRERRAKELEESRKGDPVGSPEDRERFQAALAAMKGVKA